MLIMNDGMPNSRVVGRGDFDHIDSKVLFVFLCVGLQNRSDKLGNEREKVTNKQLRWFRFPNICF